MAVRQDVIDRSRLGRVLVNRGLINEQQLTDALALHRTSGQRIGEILTSNGFITERELGRALKHQHRYRYAAAFVAMAVAPFQTSVAFAAGTVGVVPAAKTVNAFEMGRGMRPMNDEEMSGIGAQGIQEDFQQLAALVGNGNGSALSGLSSGSGQQSEEGSASPDALEVMGTMGKIFFPLANVLEAEVEIVGVTYDMDRIKPFLTEDGTGFNINLPTRIERLSFIDIRPAGTNGPTLGSMHFEGIRFSESSTLVIRPYK